MNDRLDEYVRDTRHLTDDSLSYLEQYARELNVKASVLWADLLNKNPLDVVMKVDSMIDLRTLLTKYKKRTVLSDLTETMEMMMPGIGMSMQRSMFGNVAKSYKKTFGFPKYCKCGARLKVNDGEVKCRRCGKEY